MKTIEKDMHHYILAFLLAVFIVSDIQIPSALNELVGTLLGKVIVIGAALALLFAHPLLGALGVIAAYRLVTKTQERYTPPKQVAPPTEPKKMSALNAMNQFPVTVEEEVIRKMIPQAPSNLPAPSFKPVLDSLHDAAKITASN